MRLVIEGFEVSKVRLYVEDKSGSFVLLYMIFGLIMSDKSDYNRVYSDYSCSRNCIISI